MKKKTCMTAFLFAAVAVCSGFVGCAVPEGQPQTGGTQTNIAITTSKVDVIATIGEVSATGLNGVAMVEPVVSGNSLGLNNIAPGDKVNFNITVQNNSSIKVKYRTKIFCAEGAELMSALLFTVDGEDYSGLISYVSEWSVWDKSGSYVIPVAIELPETVQDCQGVTCKITYAVEAVQGNATTEDESEFIKTKVATAEEFETALNYVNENGGTVKLADNITLTEADGVIINNSVALDLNGKTLTMPRDASFTVKDRGELSVENGTLAMSNSEVTGAAVYVEENGTVNLDGATLTADCYGIFPYGSAFVNVRNSIISASSAIATNAETSENYGAVINIEKSELIGVTGMLVNVPCTVNVTDSKLTGTFQGLVVRGGNVYVENSVISNVAEDGNLADYFDNKNWGTGNTVNLAGLTVGNKSAGSYQYPSNVTLIDTRVTSTGYYPTVYMYGNATADIGATIVYNGGCELGDIIQGGGVTEAVKADLIIKNADDLFNFASEVNGGNNYAGKTVALARDIDLENRAWSPVGEYYTSTADAHAFSGTFNGNGHTVSNLNVNSEGNNAGLFGYIQTSGNSSPVIKNLTVHNAQVSGVSRVAVIVGNGYQGRVDNCHVNGIINVTGNYQAGGLMGYGYAAVNNCSVICEEGSTVTGVYKESDLEGDSIGGLIGYSAEVSSEYTNLTVKGLSVAGTRKVGGLIGQVGTYDRLISNITVENVTVSINASREYVNGNTGKIFAGGVFGETTSGTKVTLTGRANNITVNGAVESTTGAVAGGTRSNIVIDIDGVETANITVNVL